jgi:hypothetical protein
MNTRHWLLVALAILTAAPGCQDAERALRSAPPPSGSPNDELYKEQRANRLGYSESASISACSESSGNCYALVADINHTFDDQGKETVTVERVHFDNGGYLDFGAAPIPGGGTDSKGNDWTFEW